MIRECDTCKYEERLCNEPPCRDCNDGDRFEPKPVMDAPRRKSGCIKEGETVVFWDEFLDDPNLREDCLRKANECVNESRRDKYGELEDNFETIANLWNVYLGAIAEDRADLTSVDVANMMTLLKVGRAATGINSDNYVDIAGYAACAYELMGGEYGE